MSTNAIVTRSSVTPALASSICATFARCLAMPTVSGSAPGRSPKPSIDTLATGRRASTFPSAMRRITSSRAMAAPPGLNLKRRTSPRSPVASEGAPAELAAGLGTGAGFGRSRRRGDGLACGRLGGGAGFERRNGHAGERRGPLGLLRERDHQDRIPQHHEPDSEDEVSASHGRHVTGGRSPCESSSTSCKLSPCVGPRSLLHFCSSRARGRNLPRSPHRRPP